jgi:hypothetical protein
MPLARVIIEAKTNEEVAEWPGRIANVYRSTDELVEILYIWIVRKIGVGVVFWRPRASRSGEFSAGLC